jgi:hypothetical protein
MRVFYEEEDEISKRRYYVKIDNVNVSDDLKGYKAIESVSIDELKRKILEYYKFNIINKNDIELWTQQNGNGIRLDILKEIPSNIEYMYIRIVLNK